MKTFLKGLLAAAIGGVVGGAASAVQAGTLAPKQLGLSALAGAILTAAAYMKQSPLQSAATPEQAKQ